MKKFKIVNIFLLALFFFIGCEKEDSPIIPPVEINESEELVKFMESNNNYVYAGASFVYDATTFKTDYLADQSKILIFDIRSSTDYGTKHLKGAKNVTFANLRKAFDTVTFANYNKIVVVCYSGQSAAYGVSLVRSLQPLVNANKIVSLKYGMCSIDSMFATTSWLAKRSNVRAAQFVTTPAPTKPVKGDLPKLSTGKTTGKDILIARVDSLLALGFSASTVTEATMYTTLSNYFIVNYWPAALYLDPGHVDGAYNYEPSTSPFLLANDMKTLPTNKTIAIYCYTGQSSAYVAAYLKLIGYDVKTVLYGTNGMIYDLMVSKNVASTFKPATDIKGYKDLLEP